MRPVGAALLLLLAGASSEAREPLPTPREALDRLAAIPRPLDPAFFRLDPDLPDTTFRLLVVPVRFPEDRGLGGGDLEDRLNGEGAGSLGSFYRTATGGRLALVSSLAPVVTADHARTWYTVEGEGNFGYGLDPDAYPHNARGLVEEVTSKLRDAVDFRLHDNTGDGIVDGLLLLHSGPSAVEAGDDAVPRDHLLAHAFTLETPVPQGEVLVFPYAVAATRDGVGPWAHEAGHLLGLPDLYVSNPFAVCPAEGVGEWSLMATGANREDGTDPSGLDAFSRQLLGIPALRESPEPVALAGTGALRVFRAGHAEGPQYFLVERRDGEDGLGLPSPAYVVYLVDEGAGDNRRCARPLVERRAVVCPGLTGCAVRLDDLTEPSLRDRAGDPTGLVLLFDEATVSVRFETASRLRLEAIGLDDVQDDPRGGERQPLTARIRNLDLTTGTAYSLFVDPPEGSAYAVETVDLTVIGPGATNTGTIGWIRGAQGSTSLPAGTEPFRIRLRDLEGIGSTVDTLVLSVASFGLEADRLDAFQPVDRVAGPPFPCGRDSRPENPWKRESDGWIAEAFDACTDWALASPWFAVPEEGVLLLEHAWDLEALSPDVAFDAAQVLVDPQIGPEAFLAPTLRWGYTPLRGTGSPAAGLDGLSGAGERVHVLDLAPFARRTVRLLLRAVGDFDETPGSWSIRGASALPRSPLAFEVEQDPDRPDTVQVTTSETFVPDVRLFLYAGEASIAPDRLVAGTTWDGSPVPLSASVVDPAFPDTGAERRVDLVWTDASGRAGSRSRLLEVPRTAFPAPFQLASPSPNPVRAGEAQTWALGINESSATGRYLLVLFDARGRRVVERSAQVATPGARSVSWDGRDAQGNPVAGGVYFLQARSPDGASRTRALVVLP